ncbi:hypothetical protein V1264_013874 [Littorina saxatilis]|uniref:Uncharacterized protein n=1 Tax=Littorina saxatilis TaxID=31220 RepID=A0AAN9BR17_9CAEN
MFQLLGTALAKFPRALKPPSYHNRPAFDLAAHTDISTLLNSVTDPGAGYDRGTTSHGKNWVIDPWEEGRVYKQGHPAITIDLPLIWPHTQSTHISSLLNSVTDRSLTPCRKRFLSQI